MKHRTIILPIGGSDGSEPQPSGTININREGIYDVTSYASANVEISNPIEYPNYLCFIANGSGGSIGFIPAVTIGVNNTYLEYSFDEINWIIWDFSDIPLEDGESIYFRGINHQGLSVSSSYISRFITNGTNVTFDVSGDISTLIDYANDTIIPGDYAFSRLFSGTKVTNAGGLILPYGTVGPCWYQNMFQNCDALDTVPALPATTLANNCYQTMFQNCSSLVNAPALPATTLAQSCYNSMFRGCTALVSAPALPATTLAQSCYQQMFQGCTTLTAAPELSATTLAQSCYSSMFNGCTSLVSAPALPATTLAQSCYQQMFYNCSMLESAPALPATTLAQSCYNSMFNGCTSLVTAPTELPASILVNNCYNSMFRNCVSLTKSPNMKFYLASLITTPLSQMFSGCSVLNEITVNTGLWAALYANNWVSGVAATGVFKNLGGATIPTGTNGIPTGWTEIKPDYMYFEDISGSNNTLTLTRTNTGGLAPTVTLEYSTDGQNWQEWQAVNDVRTYTIPANGKFYLRGNNTAFGQRSNNTDVHTFSSTGNIEAHGNIMTLLDKTGQSTQVSALGSFKMLFQNMTTLKTAPELPATEIAYACYLNMFNNTGITEAPDLPAPVIGGQYYNSMFKNCTSLTKAAKMTINEFKTGSGHTSACREMYSGCSALTDISGITINATSFHDSCFRQTFYNCTSLTKAVPMTIASVDNNSFNSTYNDCSALTDISGVHITATTATTGSFKTMFRGTAITESPDLSSLTTLYGIGDQTNGSLSYMFQNCSNLNKITVGFSTWDYSYTFQWCNNVPSSGDFYNLGGATIQSGNNGIPSGWTEHTTL